MENNNSLRLGDDLGDMVENEEDEWDDEKDGIYISSYVGGSKDVKVDIVAGDYNYIAAISESGVKAISPNLKEFQKIGNLYVKTEQYQLAKHKLIAGNLLLVQGEAHIGKYAAATALALDMLAESGLQPRILRFSDLTLLIDFLEDDEFATSSALLVKDAFQSPGLDLIEIKRHSAEISSILEQKGSVAILTSDTIAEDLIEIPERFQQTWQNFEVDILGKILLKHLVYYDIRDNVVALVKEHSREILTNLSKPYAIARFVRQLANTSDLNINTLSKVIETSANVQKEAKYWFDSLLLHEQYFAMLVALFETLNWYQLFEVFKLVTTDLQEEGIDIRPALQFELEKLLKPTQTVVTELDTIVFKDDLVQEFVLQKAKTDFYPQFTHLLKTLTRLVEKNAGSSREERDIRVAVATSVGELAKGNKGIIRIQPVLEVWGGNKDLTTIRATVGYSLRKLVEDPAQMNSTFEFIGRWQRDRMWQRRWSAVAALERLYPIMPEDTMNALSKSAADNNVEVSRAIAHAISAIGQRDLDQAILLIESWSDSESKNKKNAAIRSLVRLLKSPKRVKSILSHEESFLKTLDIVRKLGTLGKKNTTKQSLGILRKLKEESTSYGTEIENAVWEIWQQIKSKDQQEFYDILGDEWVSKLKGQELMIQQSNPEIPPRGWIKSGGISEGSQPKSKSLDNMIDRIRRRREGRG